MTTIRLVAENDILNRHEFDEATGGYIQCMCGWPTREQWEAEESPVTHVIAELCEAGILTRIIPPDVGRASDHTGSKAWAEREAWHEEGKSP